MLPFASEETVAKLESNIASLPSVTDLMHKGLSPQAITERLFDGIGVADSAFSMEPRYGPCEAAALKERMKQAVALLGEKDVEQLLKEQGKIEVQSSLIAARNIQHSLTFALIFSFLGCLGLEQARAAELAHSCLLLLLFRIFY